MSTLDSTQWTHRRYCTAFALNVEQYGEILVAQAFNGQKHGDAQPCFDVSADVANFRVWLAAGGISQALIAATMPSAPLDGKVRIEVKSKLRFAESGEASVIHCSDTKLNDLTRGEGTKAKTFRAMTHLAVVLVEPETFEIAGAWLLTHAAVIRLRKDATASKYVPVESVRKDPDRTGIIEITTLLQRVADAPLGA